MATRRARGKAQSEPARVTGTGLPARPSGISIDTRQSRCSKALLQRSRDHRGRGRQAPGRGALDPLPPSAPGAHRRPGGPELSPAMPIKPELRYYYPIDWPQVSHWVRFVRAKGRCEACAAGRMARSCAISATAAGGTRHARSGATAAAARSPALLWPSSSRSGPPRWCWRRRISTTIPAHCGRRHRNVKALCQRCHLLHDRPEHRRRIRLTLRRRRALGDLFSGPQPNQVAPCQARPSCQPLDRVRGPGLMRRHPDPGPRS